MSEATPPHLADVEDQTVDALELPLHHHQLFPLKTLLLKQAENHPRLLQKQLRRLRKSKKRETKRRQLERLLRRLRRLLPRLKRTPLNRMNLRELKVK